MALKERRAPQLCNRNAEDTAYYPDSDSDSDPDPDPDPDSDSDSDSDSDPDPDSDSDSDPDPDLTARPPHARKKTHKDGTPC
jgi:hypothetical protein